MVYLVIFVGNYLWRTYFLKDVKTYENKNHDDDDEPPTYNYRKVELQKGDSKKLENNPRQLYRVLMNDLKYELDRLAYEFKKCDDLPTQNQNTSPNTLFYCIVNESVTYCLSDENGIVCDHKSVKRDDLLDIGNPFEGYTLHKMSTKEIENTREVECLIWDTNQNKLFYRPSYGGICGSKILTEVTIKEQHEHELESLINNSKTASWHFSQKKIDTHLDMDKKRIAITNLSNESGKYISHYFPTLLDLALDRTEDFGYTRHKLPENKLQKLSKQKPNEALEKRSAAHRLLSSIQEKVEKKEREWRTRAKPPENSSALSAYEQEGWDLYRDLNQVLLLSRSILYKPENEELHDEIQHFAKKMSTRADFFWHVLSWLVFLLLVVAMMASIITLLAASHGTLLAVPLITPWITLLITHLGSVPVLGSMLPMMFAIMPEMVGFAALCGYLNWVREASLADALAELGGTSLASMVGNLPYIGEKLGKPWLVGEKGIVEDTGLSYEGGSLTTPLSDCAPKKH